MNCLKILTCTILIVSTTAYAATFAGISSLGDGIVDSPIAATKNVASQTFITEMKSMASDNGLSSSLVSLRAYAVPNALNDLMNAKKKIEAITNLLNCEHPDVEGALVLLQTSKTAINSMLASVLMGLALGRSENSSDEGKK